MGHLNLCSRMKHFLPLAALVTLGSAQFVFFGNGRPAPQQSFARSAPAAPAPPAPRPLPVQPQRFSVARPQPSRLPSPSLPSSGRFAGTFFRPDRKLHHPGKNPLPEEKPEDVKFVEILTEKPEAAEAPRSSAVVVPAAVVVTTAAPVTTKAPVTTTKVPVTTQAPVTTVPTVRVTPLQIKSSIVNSFGAPVVRPAATTAAPRPAPVVTTVNPRQPKALAPKPKGNYQ